MNKDKILLLGLMFLCSLSSAQEDSKEDSSGRDSQILTVLRAEFQKRNPIIKHVELFDVRPLLLNPINYPEKPNHFLIVARGVGKDGGSWKENELIGLFLLDDSLFAVKRVVAFIPTQRRGDFIVKIMKVRKDSVTIQGFDLERGYTDFTERYYLLK